MVSIAFNQDLYFVGRPEMPLRATLIAQPSLSIFLSNVSSIFLFSKATVVNLSDFPSDMDGRMNVTWCSCIKPVTSVNDSAPFRKR